MDTKNNSQTTPTEPTISPAVLQREINRHMRSLAQRGGRSKSPKKMKALEANRAKRWQGHQKQSKLD